jgi:glycosyltransferase involved in cell wall biosynthesis
MKILFIPTTGGVFWGGSEVLWFRTCKIALKDGHSCLILVDNINKVSNQIKHLQKEGAVLISKNSFIWNIYKFLLKINYYSRLNPIKKFIISKMIRQDIDFLCISQGGTFNIIWDTLLYQFVNSTNKPFFLISQFNYEHQYLSYNQIKRARSFLAKAKEMVFVSEKNKQNAERQLAQPIKNAFLITNPLNLDSYHYIPWPQTDTVTMAVVARLECAFKGQDILLQVLKEAKWIKRSWTVNLFGEGKDELYLKDLVKYYGLESKVNFCGHTGDIRKLWYNNQILLLPSIGEGTPLALLEAMVCGRPAVVTNVGGNTEVVNEGINGFIADAPTPKLLDEALEKAWSCRKDWMEMGKQAHSIALKKLDLDSPRTLLNNMLQKV